MSTTPEGVDMLARLSNELALDKVRPRPLGLSPRRELGRTLGAKARGRFAVTQRNRRPGDGAQSVYTFLCNEE